MKRFFSLPLLTGNSRTPIRWLPLVVAVTSLAIGGCDSTSGEDPQPVVNTGQFVDSAVINIGFRTETRSGVTNDNGEFTYLNNETVTFFIGSIELPASAAKPILSPLDLVNTTDSDDLAVVNIARLLQSLDVDGDPSNGLQIGDDAAANTAGLVVDFRSPDFDAVVTNLVANSGSVITALISPQQARAHLEQTLDIIPPDRDGDGVADYLDAFPDDPDESIDSDGDGVGDNGDYAPDDPTIQTICQSDASDEEKNAAGCANDPPIAVAGDDQLTEPTKTITLDGSGSYDPEGRDLTYLWEIISGPTGAVAGFDDATRVQPAFAVGDLEGEFILQLTVSDGFNSASDRVTITVQKSMPQASTLFASALLVIYWLNRYRRQRGASGRSLQRFRYLSDARYR